MSIWLSVAPTAVSLVYYSTFLIRRLKSRGQSSLLPLAVRSLRHTSWPGL